jgi:hypothetical protein
MAVRAEQRMASLMEKMHAWRNDPQFKELRQIGEKHAKFHSYALEGVAQ